MKRKGIHKCRHKRRVRTKKGRRNVWCGKGKSKKKLTKKKNYGWKMDIFGRTLAQKFNPDDDELREPRSLLPIEIDTIAHGRGINEQAVSNFLSTADVSPKGNVSNLYMDAQLYGWNRPTIDAISRGLKLMNYEPEPIYKLDKKGKIHILPPGTKIKSKNYINPFSMDPEDSAWYLTEKKKENKDYGSFVSKLLHDERKMHSDEIKGDRQFRDSMDKYHPQIKRLHQEMDAQPFIDTFDRWDIKNKSVRRKQKHPYLSKLDKYGIRIDY